MEKSNTENNHTDELIARSRALLNKSQMLNEVFVIQSERVKQMEKQSSQLIQNSKNLFAASSNKKE